MTTTKRLLPVFIVLCGALAWGQTLFPKKTLAIAQIAVGEIIDTTLTITNRGAGVFEATLFLYRGTEGAEWNPIVNGDTVSEGRVAVNLPSGETTSFTFTGTALDEGFSILVPRNFDQDNFVEGSLTYQIRQDGALVDSIGILSSEEFTLATVPFESFDRVALSLVNPDIVDEQDANVTLRLFDEDGDLVSTEQETFSPLAHNPEFLSQFFPGVVLGRGRLDIVSDIPIFGTALNLEQGQLSALPLNGAVRTYDIEMVGAGQITARGGASIWHDGLFVSGYIVIDEVGGVPLQSDETFLLYGRLVAGSLRASFYGRSEFFSNREVNVYFSESPFGFANGAVSTDYIATFLDNNTVAEGTLTLTPTN